MALPDPAACQCFQRPAHQRLALHREHGFGAGVILPANTKVGIVANENTKAASATPSD